MNQEIFGGYTTRIQNALKNGPKRGRMNKSRNFSDSIGAVYNAVNFNASQDIKLMDLKSDETLFESLKPLSSIAGTKAKYHLKPGSHPDFSNVKGDLVENHYITSMFIDIKKSTNLFKKYEPIVVANITNTIQRAAVHVCWYFDGYIQRFHGDGLMVYFGNKTSTIKQSVDNACMAASILSYFMENDLQNIFLEQDVEKIYTRIGIDTGEAADVLWYQAGMGECSEISTCSLHTSLAAHMQGNAGSNGIMVGDNVKAHTTFNQELFSIKGDRYIFNIPEENFNYTQWDFNWKSHLKKHPLLEMHSNGKLYFANSIALSVLPQSRPQNVDYLKTQTAGYKPHFK